MVYDEEGCEYPKVDRAQCVDCGLCERACPILNAAPEIRRMQRAFLMQHRDSEVLLQSTSGGAFTALAQVVIAHGGIVFGAGYLRSEQMQRDPDSPARLKVGHVGVDDERYLWRFRNSKYVQSAMGPAFREVREELRGGREVFFIGTPCQCEGLLRFLGACPDGLLLGDVVCRAVPARVVFARYLEWLDGKTGGKAETVLFRDKHAYGYRYSNLAAMTDGDSAQGEVLYREGVETDPYLRAFFSNVCDRPSCYACAFKKRYRESDVTCWDFFDVHRLSKVFDDNRGVTRILAHTVAGAKLVSAAQAFARVEEVDVEAATEGVREMTESVPLSTRRAQFMAEASVAPGPELFDRWFPDSLPVKAERCARHAILRLGVYDSAKRMAKVILGRQ